MKRLLVVANDEHLARLIVEASSARGWEACTRSRFDSRDPLVDWAEVLLVSEEVVSPGEYRSLATLGSGERRVPVVLLADEAAPLAARLPGAPIVVGRPFVIPELLDALDEACGEIVDLTTDEPAVDISAAVIDLTAVEAGAPGQPGEPAEAESPRSAAQRGRRVRF